MAWAAAPGGRPGDVIHNAYGSACYRRSRRPLRRGAAGATVVPMSGGSTERQIALINDFRRARAVRNAVLRTAIAEAGGKGGRGSAQIQA